MKTDHRQALEKMARHSDDLLGDWSDAAEAALVEIARLTGLVKELAAAGEGLLAAAKVGERTFWNAANAMLAAIRKAKAQP